MIRHKVVELSTVTDAEIEATVNEWTEQGWTFECVQFAMRDSSKRPSMAFVFFTKKMASPEEEEAERKITTERRKQGAGR